MDQNLNPGQESVSIELKNVSKHYGETLVLTPFRSRWKPAAVPCCWDPPVAAKQRCCA